MRSALRASATGSQTVSVRAILALLLISRTEFRNRLITSPAEKAITNPATYRRLRNPYLAREIPPHSKQ
jgi:hypothetical protein